MRLLEVVGNILCQDRRREGSKGLALLDPLIQDLLHVGATRVNNNGAISKTTRPELHSALEPSDDFAIRNVSCSRSCYFDLGESLVGELAGIQFDANLIVRKLGPGVRALHHEPSRLLQQIVVDLVADAQRCATVARG